jgi:hypothetical protein
LPSDIAHHSADPLVDTLDDEEMAGMPLSPAQRSMVYPEVLHGDRTYNNVVYLLQENAVRSQASLAGIHAALIERFPLLGCVVVDADDGYAFEPAAHATTGVDPDLTDHDEAGACVSHYLARSISLFEGPLLTLFRARIGGRVHVGVRFHHVVGDHIGQTEILRAIVELATGGAVPPRSLSSLAAVNRRLVRRAELEHEDCRAFWAAQKIRVPELAARPLTDALSPCVRRRRVAGARRDRVPSEQMLRWLAATAAALEDVFAIRDPVVHCLFSLREQEVGLGFQTCLAPVALTPELVTGGEPTPALLDAMLATRRHCVIGLEELLLAADLARARIPFLFNFVDLRAEDHRWWSEHLLDAPSEPCKTELDVSVVRAGDVFDVTITTRYDAGCAEAILDRLEAAWR